MRFVNPATGEVSDRLTILALKILAGAEKGVEVAHWETERASLLTVIRTKTLNGKWFEAVLELGAVNAMIWHAEDEMRTWRQTNPVVDRPEAISLWVQVGRLAFRIQALNDRRAELVAQINREAGDGDAKEKG
jgi:hypothetical protein